MVQKIGYPVNYRDFRFGNKILRYSRKDVQLLNVNSGYQSVQTTLSEMYKNYKPTGRNLLKIDISSKNGEKMAQIRHIENNDILKALQVDITGNFRTQIGNENIMCGNIFGGYRHFGEILASDIKTSYKKAKQIFKTLKS